MFLLGNQTLLHSLGIPLVHNLPGVGQNLQDHLITNLGAENTGLPNAVGQDLDAAAFQEWLVNKTGPYSSIGGRTVYFIRTKYQDVANDSRPDIEVILGSPVSLFSPSPPSPLLSLFS
jgi:choline dehydrogenase